MGAIKKMPPAVAAKMMGVTIPYVYALLQYDKVQWGYAKPPEKKGGKWNYYINPRAFADIERWTLEEVEAECRKYETLGYVKYRQDKEEKAA